MAGSAGVSPARGLGILPKILSTRVQAGRLRSQIYGLGTLPKHALHGQDAWVTVFVSRAGCPCYDFFKRLVPNLSF